MKICGTTKKERLSKLNEISNLAKDCGKDLVLIGSGDEAEILAAAIIGYDNATYAVLYDYDKLVEAMMSYNKWTEEEAIEWIDYNTIRSLEYMYASSDNVVAPRIVNKI